MTTKPSFVLRAGVDLWDLGVGRYAKLDIGGAVSDSADLPFTIDAAGSQLPNGKASFYMITTGEVWILAGGHAGIPLQCFAGTPVAAPSKGTP